MLKATWTAGMLVICLSTGCSKIPGTTAYKERQATDVLKETMLDPESLMLRNVRTSPNASPASGKPGLCGELNAKNKMGGYVGFRKFVVDLQNNTALVEMDTTYTDGDLIDAEKSCSDGARYGSTAMCDRASEMKQEMDAAVQFGNIWRGMCETPLIP